MVENKKIKILVTDNDQDFLAIAEHKLSMRGFLVTVSPLQDAVKILKKDSIDFIFMDISKTSNDGAAILKHVGTLSSKPVIQYFGLHSNNNEDLSKLEVASLRTKNIGL